MTSSRGHVPFWLFIEAQCKFGQESLARSVCVGSHDFKSLANEVKPLTICISRNGEFLPLSKLDSRMRSGWSNKHHPLGLAHNGSIVDTLFQPRLCLNIYSFTRSISKVQGFNIQTSLLYRL